LGVTWFVLDPYQIGHENEEALKSGAFWFYRKMGFHSTDAALRELTAREEKKIAADASYRVPPRTLRKLVCAPMVYGFPGAQVSDWYGFETRRLGMSVARANGWSKSQSKLLAPFFEAKQAIEEADCLRVMREQPGIRAEILRLGRERTLAPPVHS
jgi:hypothetical protein